MNDSPQPVDSFLVDALRVEVYPSEDAMAVAAARDVRLWLQDLLSRQESVAAIFASATSQIRFLRQLTAAEGIRWEQVTLFHMDEYLGIEDSHPASFRRFMREHMAAKLAVDEFHTLTGDAEEPLKECQRYAELLSAREVDLCCLGIGENGHIAFNDPPVADFEDPFDVKLVKLDEPCRQQQVGEGCFPSLAAVPQYAFTLTVPTLCRARRLFCVVPEKRKAEAVKQALREPVSERCPASALRRHKNATLYLDAASASLL